MLTQNRVKLGVCAFFIALLLGICLGEALSKTTLVFWTNDPYSDEGNAAIQKVIDDFCRTNPDIQIKWVQQPASYYDKLLTAFAGGVAPDVFYIRPGTDLVYQRQGLAYDIDPLVKRDEKELDIKDFFEPQLKELKADGKWWCLPYDYSCIVLLYNVEAFEKTGLLPPASTWTWEDVIAAGLKLRQETPDKKVGFWGFGDMSYYLSQWAEGFIMSFGGRLFDDDLTRACANSPETANALSVISKMAQFRLFPMPGEADIYRIFESGKAGMTLYGSWGIWAKVVGMPDFNFDIAMLPNGLPGKRVVAATGGAWAMCSQTKHPEAAWKFLKHLVSPEVQRILMVNCSQSLPPRKSLINEWVARFRTRSRGSGPLHAILAGEQIVKYGRNISPVGFGFSLSTVTSKYFWPLANRQISPTEAALRIENELNVELEKARKSARK